MSNYFYLILVDNASGSGPVHETLAPCLES